MRSVAQRVPSRKWGMYRRLVVVLSAVWIIAAASYVGYQQARRVSDARQSAAGDCQSDRQYARRLIWERDQGNRVALLLSQSSRPERELRRDCVAEGERAYAAALPIAAERTAIWTLLPLPIFWLIAALGACAYTWVLAGRGPGSDAPGAA